MTETLKYSLISITEAIRPRDGFCDVRLNHWWAIVDDSILIYGRSSPQCNKDRRITERLLHLAPEGAEVRLIPMVFLPHNCSDYL